jgi:hypothetical protein
MHFMNNEELQNLAPFTMQFIERAQYFGHTDLDQTRFLILRDASAADFYSWKQDSSDIDFDPTTKFKHWVGSNFECWRDVRDEETKHFVGRAPVPAQRFSRLASEQLWSDAKFPANMLEKIGTLRDEMSADLEACFKNEAYGFPSKFYKTLLDAYLSGGWPCGWLGKYPEGKMIVLDPNPK